MGGGVVEGSGRERSAWRRGVRGRGGGWDDSGYSENSDREDGGGEGRL